MTLGPMAPEGENLLAPRAVTRKINIVFALRAETQEPINTKINRVVGRDASDLKGKRD